MRMTLIAAALLGALLTGVPASSTPNVALFGVGVVDSGACAGLGVIFVEGAGADGIWSFTAEAFGASSCVIPALATGLGTWDPSEGGCVGLLEVLEVCVGKVQQTPSIDVHVSMHDPLHGDISTDHATVVPL
jgi:hypothetical protein